MKWFELFVWIIIGTMVIVLGVTEFDFICIWLVLIIKILTELMEDKQ